MLVGLELKEQIEKANSFPQNRGKTPQAPYATRRGHSDIRGTFRVKIRGPWYFASLGKHGPQAQTQTATMEL